MDTFDLVILAAEKPFYEGKCLSLEFPTVEGSFGILAHHSNMIAAITPGILKLGLPDGENVLAAVTAGIIKVENNNVLILADTVERPEEIDINRAMRAAERAKEEMLQKKSIHDYYNAQMKMSRALSRIKVKRYNMD